MCRIFSLLKLCRSTGYIPTVFLSDDDMDVYPCYRASCECDKAIAHCFFQTLADYNQDYVGFPSSKCITNSKKSLAGKLQELH